MGLSVGMLAQGDAAAASFFDLFHVALACHEAPSLLWNLCLGSGSSHGRAREHAPHERFRGCDPAGRMTPAILSPVYMSALQVFISRAKPLGH